ncbi:MAG: hypothetical protein DMF90_28035, partial [Acidobacteria bacterium]
MTTTSHEPGVGARHMKVTILTGGRDSHYALPLVASLSAQPTQIDVICSEEFPVERIATVPNVRHLLFYRLNAKGVPSYQKVLRLIATYLRLLAYAVRTDSRIFHILWQTRFEYVDTLILNPMFKILGRSLVLTVHNVDAGERDGRSSSCQRWLLRRLYRQMDHLFVHTQKTKEELTERFAVDRTKVTVVAFGLNTVVPESPVTRTQARQKLGLEPQEKVVLFFGHITPYKGVEYLVEAVARLRSEGWEDLRLVIAGDVKDRAATEYYAQLLDAIDRLSIRGAISLHTDYIPDADVELYFKAADVCVLPYKLIFQSGVLFLSYRFGLPVVVSDVGSMRDDVEEGRTGFVCRPEDPASLAETLRRFFKSPLFTNAE